jgi:DNA-binding NtrC family response regulator
VRELEHEVERAALLAAEPVIQPRDFSSRLAAACTLLRTNAQSAAGMAQSAPGMAQSVAGVAQSAPGMTPSLPAASRAGNLAEKLGGHPDLLRNILRRMAAYSFNAAPFAPVPAREQRAASCTAPITAGAGGFAETVPPSLLEAERELTQRALHVCGGNKTHAARRLGLSREGLRKKLKRLGLA